MDKIELVNDLYHSSVISSLAIGYSMVMKKILNISPPSIQKFDGEDIIKLVGIITASEMTREWLVKEKIIPENIKT